MSEQSSYPYTNFKESDSYEAIRGRYASTSQSKKEEVVPTPQNEVELQPQAEVPSQAQAQVSQAPVYLMPI